MEMYSVMCQQNVKSNVYLVVLNSLVPRPSTPPVFDCLQYAKYRGRRPGEFHHMIHGKVDITDSRCNSLFTFVSTVTEKVYRELKQVPEER